MNSFEKLGYILIGSGLGVFVATLMYEREMRKPVGEIEEYIPTEDREDNSEHTDISQEDAGVEKTNVANEFSKTDTHILDYYKSDSEDSIGVKNLEDRAKKRREEFEKSRANGRNQTTRYSQMYEGGDDIDDERERRVAEMLQAQRDANVDFNRRMNEKAEEARKRNLEKEYMAYITKEDDSTDIPSDDIPYDDDSLASDLVRERVENNFEIYLDENP